MNASIQKMLESKRAVRKGIAALPFARKLELLEKLRDRSQFIASSTLRPAKRNGETEKGSGLES